MTTMLPKTETEFPASAEGVSPATTAALAVGGTANVSAASAAPASARIRRIRIAPRCMPPGGVESGYPPGAPGCAARTAARQQRMVARSDQPELGSRLDPVRPTCPLVHE